MKRWFKYVKPYLSSFILGPVGMIVEVIGEMFMPLLLAELINRANDGVLTVGDSLGVAGMLIAIVLLMMTGGVAGAYFGAKASVNFAADLRRDLYTKVQQYSFANIDKFSASSLVTRMTNDVTQLQNFVNMLLRMALRSPGMLIGGIIMAVSLKPSLSVILAVTMPIMLVVLGLELMKKLNINCVRTSHYPPHPKFVDMCDEMGFYVVLECDNEAHGFIRRYPNRDYDYDVTENEWPCSHPDWIHEHEERMARTYERDKNHASIIIWSLGNEAGYHRLCNDPMINYIREHDGERLVHFESACWRQEGIDKTDLYSCMYPSIERTIKELTVNDRKKPVYFCEFSHAMGNGPGDVWQYVELMYQYDNYIGGCIWEWADHVVVVDGVQKYGGDFPGELTHDGNFCCDGLVFADRSLKAGSYETKAAYAPFRFEFKAGRIKITNHYDFTNLENHTIKYSVRVDDETVEEKKLKIKLAPKKSAFIKVDNVPKECKYGACIDVELFDAQGNSLGLLSQALECKVVAEKKELAPASIVNDTNFVYVSGEGFLYRYNKQIGNFDSMIVNGEELLCEGVKMSSFRALTDNDKRMSEYWSKQTTWKGENIDYTSTKIYKVTVNKNTIIAEGSLGGISIAPYFRFKLKTTVYVDGRISYSLTGDVRKDAVWLPRLGFEFTLNKDNKQFTYYGMGPDENYCDMCHHARLGMYESSSDMEYVNYVRPQEHGNHMKTRMLNIEDKIEFTGKNFEFNVSNYSIEQTQKAQHTDEFGESTATHVRIDYKVSGVGSSSCGPDILPEYTVNEKNIVFNFEVKPL